MRIGADLYSLKDKNIVIVGATGGIGLAVAKAFASDGARVTITGRRESGEAIAKDAGVSFERFDSTDSSQMEKAFDRIRDAHGDFDCLIVNAGIADDEGSIETYDGASMQRMMAVNFNGVFFALQLAPRFVADGGSIITTGSVSGSGAPNPGGGVYAASKAAVAYLSRTSALELAARGIRVNTVCPALIAGTGMMTDDDGGDEARALARLTAFGRMGKQSEVVGIYHFLAGDGSTFITGQEICVDGGLTAGIGQPLMDAIFTAN